MEQWYVLVSGCEAGWSWSQLKPQDTVVDGVALTLFELNETASVFVQLREPVRDLVDVLLRHLFLRAFQIAYSFGVRF